MNDNITIEQTVNLFRNISGSSAKVIRYIPGIGDHVANEKVINEEGFLLLLQIMKVITTEELAEYLKGKE